MPRQEFTILLVEDAEDQIDRFQGNIADFNEDEAQSIIFNLEVAKSVAEAEKKLNRTVIDVGVLDLRLPSEVGMKEGAGVGNVLIEKLLEQYPIPFAVNSGHSGELSEKIRNRKSLLVVDKGPKDHEAILQWICKWAPLMSAMSNTQHQIRLHTARVFAGAIWDNWTLHGKGLNPEALNPVVTRQVLSYLAEELSLPDSGPAYHLYEFYFCPPIRSSLHTGDLVRWEERVYVVVTPRCDMSRAKSVLLCLCEELGETWAGIMRANGNNRLKKIQEWTHHNIDIRSHFLPPVTNLGPWKVNFRSVISVSADEGVALQENRIASITPQFIPSLIQRFSSYLGRIGQPELDVGELIGFHEVHVKKHES